MLRLFLSLMDIKIGSGILVKRQTTGYTVLFLGLDGGKVLKVISQSVFGFYNVEAATL